MKEIINLNNMLASHLKFSKYYKLTLFWCLFYLWICSVKCIVKISNLFQGNIIESYHQFEVYRILFFAVKISTTSYQEYKWKNLKIVV